LVAVGQPLRSIDLAPGSYLQAKWPFSRASPFVAFCPADDDTPMISPDPPESKCYYQTTGIPNISLAVSRSIIPDRLEMSSSSGSAYWSWWFSIYRLGSVVVTSPY